MAIGGTIAMSNVVDITRWQSSRIKDVCSYFCGIVFVIIVFCNSTGIVDWHYGYALLGVIAIWLLYDKIVQGRVFCSKYRWLATACGFTFFIYLVHEPILLIFKKLPLLISSSELMLTVCFLLVPLVFIVTIIYVGILLRKLMPRAFSIYTGGR